MYIKNNSGAALIVVTNKISSDPTQIHKQLYQAARESDISTERKLRSILSIGCKYLDIETACIQRQAYSGTWKIVTSVGGGDDVVDEEVVDRQTTLLNEEIIEHNRPFAFPNSSDQAQNPVNLPPEERTWGEYIGATISTEADNYFIVSFSSETQTDRVFSANEKALVEFVARLLDQCIKSASDEGNWWQQHRSGIANKTIFDTISDPLFVTDSPLGTIQTVNRSAVDITGRSVDELQNSPILELFPNENRKQYRALLKRSPEIQTQGQFEDGSLLYLRDSTGDDIPITLRREKINDGSGNLIVFTRNISDRRAREKAVERRGRLIEVFDRVLRHNIRNDMNIISGFADVITSQTDGDVTDMAQRINRTASELAELSDTVRTFQTELRNPEPLAPRNVSMDIQSVVKELTEKYPDREFIIDAPDSATVQGTSQLKRVLRELGYNAAKYTDSPVKFTVDTTGDNTSIFVQDSGDGLPEKERMVLEDGEETPLNHGSGLALLLVNWIIASIGGEISVFCDSGTTIVIELPEPTETSLIQKRRRELFVTETLSSFHNG